MHRDAYQKIIALCLNDNTYDVNWMQSDEDVQALLAASTTTSSSNASGGARASDAGVVGCSGVSSIQASVGSTGDGWTSDYASFVASHVVAVVGGAESATTIKTTTSTTASSVSS